MFYSNPFPQHSSSTSNVFSPSNSFFDHEKNDVYFDPFDFYLHTHNIHTSSQIMQNVTAAKQDSIVLQYSEDHDDLLDSVISPYKKKIATSSKKDGHSKIYTAQGPRDRRVRLSIEIAQKFFCLQDLLGFDKASKTLDWLLTKSLIAIKDLVEQSNNNCSSSTVTDESKVKFLETIENNGKKKKSVIRAKCADGKKKKVILKCKGRFAQENNVARDQSRAEARARARERTKEKMRVKRLDGGCESSSWGQIGPQNDLKDSGFEIRAVHE